MPQGGEAMLIPMTKNIRNQKISKKGDRLAGTRTNLLCFSCPLWPFTMMRISKMIRIRRVFPRFFHLSLRLLMFQSHPSPSFPRQYSVRAQTKWNSTSTLLNKSARQQTGTVLPLCLIPAVPSRRSFPKSVKTRLVRLKSIVWNARIAIASAPAFG
jgi:hypothetical protein